MTSPDLVLAAIGANSQSAALIAQQFAGYQAATEAENLALTQQAAGLVSEINDLTNQRDAALAEVTRLAPMEAQLAAAQVQNNNNSQLLDSQLAQINALEAQVAAALAALNPA